MTSAIDRCLDVQAMRDHLQAALPHCADGRLRIERVRLAKVRRSSSIRRNPHPLTLRYELVLRDTTTGEGSMLDVYAKMVRGGAAGVDAPQALRIDALDLLLWPWPADPGLPQLPELLDPRAAQPWSGRPASAVHTLRHEPERRASLRYDAADGGAPVYAKTFAHDGGAAIHRRFVHFRDASLADPRFPLVAEPLGYCTRTRTVWQAAAPGEPLAQALLHGRPQDLHARLADAIAAVHGAPLDLASTKQRDTAHWVAEIGRRVQKIGRACPALAARAEAVGAALVEQAQRLPAHAACVIHGDWHPEQVWLAGGRAVVFDFDEFCLGDPMEDLAEFVTKLGAPQRELGVMMLAAYAELYPGRFDLNRLHWHAAVQQLLQAGRAFIFQVDGWPEVLEQRLARAEQLSLPQQRLTSGVLA